MEIEEKGKVVKKDNELVIYADPAWEFKVWSDKGKKKSPENHYPTMKLDDIKKYPIPDDKNAILFLWATAPKLRKHWRLWMLGVSNIKLVQYGTKNGLAQVTGSEIDMNYYL